MTNSAIIKALLGVFFKNNIRAMHSKKSLIITYILVGFTLLYMASIMAVSALVIVPIFHNAGEGGAIINMYMSVIAIVLAVFGAGGVIMFLYFGKDSEFLASLPIKGRTVFTAKILYIYLQELVVSTIFCFPTLVAAGISIKASFLYYLLIPIILLCLPLLPTLFITLVSMPVMYLAKHVRNRGAFVAIARILIIGAVMVLYLWILLSATSSGFSESIEAAIGSGDVEEAIKEMIFISLSPSVNSLKYIFAPIWFLLNSVTGATMFSLSSALSGLAYFSAGIAILAGIIFGTYYIAQALYPKGVLAQLEAPRSKKSSKQYFYKQTGVKLALIKREFFDILRHSNFAFQCFAGIIMCPLLVAIMMIFSRATDELGNYYGFAIAFFMLISMGSGMNVAAMSSISREGKSFWLLKAIPVKFESILQAKKSLYCAITMTACLLGLIVIAAMGMPILALISLGFFIPYAYATTCFGIYIDLKNPNLNWSSPLEVVKNGKNIMIPTLVNLGVSFGVLTPVMIVCMASEDILAICILLAVLSNLAGLFALGAHMLLHKNYKNFLNKIEP